MIWINLPQSDITKVPNNIGAPSIELANFQEVSSIFLFIQRNANSIFTDNVDKRNS